MKIKSIVLSLAALAALLAAGLCAWHASVGGSFLYDDDHFIVQNEAIRSLAHPARFFTDPLTLAADAELAKDNYRPLTTLGFALSYRLWGLNPRPYHWINVLFHLANALLVFGLAWRLRRRAGGPEHSGLLVAWLAAAVFLLHPVQCETVAWASQRSGIVGLFLMLLAWHALLSAENARAKAANAFAAAGLGLFCASLLTKEAGAMFPLLLLAQRWLLPAKREAGGALAPSSAPYFAAVAALVLVKRIVVGRVAQGGYLLGAFWPTFLTTLKGFSVYLKLLVKPWPLSVEYMLPTSFSPAEPGVLLSALLIAAALAWAWRARRARPLAAFGVVFFFLNLAPVSNIIAIRTILNERLLYTSMIGFAFVAADVVERLAAAGPRRRMLALAGCLLTLSACAGLDRRRCADWRDQKALASANLKTCPTSPTLHYGMGRVDASEGFMDEAAREFETTLALDPSYERARADLGRLAALGPERLELEGLAWLRRADAARAAAYLEQAAAQRPADLEFKSNLAVGYAQSGRRGQAVALLKRVLARAPGMEKARRNLALYQSAAPSQTLAPPPPPAPRSPWPAAALVAGAALALLGCSLLILFAAEEESSAPLRAATLAMLAALVAAGWLSWGRVMSAGFVYDDEVLVQKNEAIRSLTPLAKFWTPQAQSADPAMRRMIWRPANAFLYAAIYAVGGLDPRDFHVAVLAFHILDALLVFGLVWLLFDSRATAWLTALVFLLHPAQSESVAWVSGLANPACLCFYLLSFIAFLRRARSPVFYGASMGLFVLALLFKEMAITLPLVLALCVWRDIGGEGGRRRAGLLAVLPFLALAAGFAAVRARVVGQTAQAGYWAGGLYPQMLTMLKGFALYVKLTLLPWPLSLEYLLPAQRSVDAGVLACAALLVGLLGLGFWAMKTRPRLGLGILFFLISLAPVSNVIPLTTIINERFLYFSMIGWGLVLSELLEAGWAGGAKWRTGS